MSTAPANQESALVATARGLAAQAVGAEQVKRAVDAAKNVVGVVITTEADAIVNADTAKTIHEGMKVLKKAKDAVLAIPKAMTAAVNEVCRPLEAALEAGKKASNDAALAYRERVAAAQRAAALAQQRAAEEMARKAAEERAQFGTTDAEEEVVALEPPTAPAKPPTMVRGSSGGQVFSDVLTCELVNHHECDPAWLTLRNADALAWFRDQMQRGEVAKPGDALHPVEERGVRYWYKPSVANR